MSKKFLFISHEASQTGAPIVLLHLLTWLRKNTTLEFDILLLKGGELSDSFVNIAKTYHWQNRNFDSKYFFLRGFFIVFYKTMDKIFKSDFYKKRLIKLIKKNNYDLMYCNTIASSHVIALLKKKETKVISHIHELSWVINTQFKSEISTEKISLVDLFIAVSKSTKNNLLSYGIDEDKIKLAYEFIPVSELSKPEISRDVILSNLGLKENVFIVGSSGKMQKRKGTDLFFSLSWLIQKKNPELNIEFVWVGAKDYEEVQWYFHETNIQGLKTNVHFTGLQNNPQNFFQIFDLFVLTSREDPFPLVCLEAASLNKPIICFEESGGMTEFVDKGGGFKIPYLDLDSMADKIVELYQNREILNQTGLMAKRIVNDYDVDKIAPIIFDEINRLTK